MNSERKRANYKPPIITGEVNGVEYQINEDRHLEYKAVHGGGKTTWSEWVKVKGIKNIVAIRRKLKLKPKRTDFTVPRDQIPVITLYSGVAL
jgi:hypothetical protein